MRGSDLDSIVADYERAFSLDSNTDIDDFVPAQTDARYSDIVTELIRVELELAWGTDKQKSIDQYSNRFPGVLRDQECFDRIAFEEYRLRVKAGEIITPHDYEIKYGIKPYHWPILNNQQMSLGDSRALIPSSWRRCTIIVGVIGILPIAICTIAAVSFHGFTFSYFQSFLLQMAIWMATGAGIAIYGVRRLEENQYRLLRSGKLGKYRLIRRIAIGGMGSVYEAEHTMLNRRCAVKIIHPKWSLHPHLLLRFEREVQVLAGISHPHIVQIHDYGFTNDGIFYFVMEYLDGKNLEQTVNDDGPLSPDKTIEVLTQVADALTVIHQGGIVHRDVKPSNIFLAKTIHGESIKLLDFGLTKSVASPESNQQLTQDGAIIGTPAYMSPEQAAGHPVDHRTDLYSLGAVAYFALAGDRIFDLPTTVETLTAHINSKPPPIEENGNSIPPQLQNVLFRCLSKDPACRFQTAAELSRALREIKI